MKKALILGDSNTWGYDPRGYFQRYDLTYIDYLNDLVPGWMFFEDAINGRLLRDVKEDTFDVDSMDKRKLLILCPPILQFDEFRDESMKLNEAYKVMGLPCLDCNPLNMSFDGVHLSEKGHKELAIKIAEYMKKISN